ncbi:MAG: methyltransferase [bacterium]|nr:methyltransferase [bacterium]
MNSKERVHAALRREPVDRVPIFMWFHPEMAVRLECELEIPPGAVAEAMGDDIRQTWVGNNHAMEGITHERDGEGHTDVWGIEWEKLGPFNQIRYSPLQKASREEILGSAYPEDRMEELLRNMEPFMAEAEEYFIGCDVSPCLFEMVCRLRGMEEAMLDLAADPDLADVMLAQAEAFSLKLSEAACARFALDWFWTGDDVGGQQAMMMSPQCWRELIRPRLERIFQVGKAHGLWVAYHSCGAIRPMIPDLIEMGLDVLNPIQCNCPGMDAADLKKEFGRDLAFMGGVDTQGLLPNGTADEVRQETERLLEVMTSGGGGYILAASHTVPPEAPLENVFAMYEAAGVSREEIFDRASEIRSR